MKISFAGIIVLFSTVTAYSGELYGTISDEASKPVKGAVVIVRTADNKTEIARDTTSEAGAYRVFVRKPGACKVVVLRDKAEIAGDAVAYPNPVRYNWIVEKKESALILRRVQ
jgi:hypothetical protein